MGEYAAVRNCTLASTQLYAIVRNYTPNIRVLSEQLYATIRGFGVKGTWMAAYSCVLSTQLYATVRGFGVKAP